MRPDLIQDLYDKEESHWWTVAKGEMVLSMVENIKNRGPLRKGLVLDIGCGTGMTAKLLEGNWDVVGIDVAWESLSFCRKRGLSRLCQGDLSDFALPFRDRSFDLLLLLDVLEHVEDDLMALSECRRVLKDGGAFIVTVPAFMALWSPWDEALGHKRRYLRRVLSERARLAVLSVRQSSYIFFFVFPLAVLFRRVKRLFQKDPQHYSTDFVPLPNPVNRFLISLGRIEQFLIGKLGWSLPFGLSVISILERKREGEEGRRQ